MDCRIAQQNIDLFVDGLLSEKDRQQLLDHAASCAACQKALDDAVRIKKALASLPEMEPPKGLAMSAIKKAKKRKPLFVYVSAATAAVAAVIALVVVLTPGIGLNNATRSSDAGQMDMMAAKEESAAADAAPAEQGEGFAMEAPEVAMSQMAEEDWPDEEAVEAAPRDMSGYVYASEEEFVDAEQSSYYKPAALPDGAELTSISMDEESFVFTYSLADGSQFTFAWLDALEDNGLTGSLKKKYGDLSSLDYNGTYYTVKGESMTDVYWQQEGETFHATVPTSWTAQDIETYCQTQFVEVQETDELQ